MVSLRILHCMRAPVGGLFRHVRDLARAQAELGHDVGVICDSVSGDRLTEERLDALSADLSLGLHRFPMSREVSWQDRLSYIAIRELAASIRPGILHGHGAKGGAFARLTASHLKQQGIRSAAFYTPHGGSLNFAPRSLKGRMFIALERRLLPMTDGLIFESGHAGSVFAERIDADRVPRRVVHNGLHETEFELAAPSPEAAEFLFVGELSPIKGVDVLLKALQRVHQRHTASGPAARLLVVGDGKQANELRILTRNLGLANSVTFRGAMPIRQAFSSGRCMIMPSRSESLPYVALETIAAGLPLIATRVGGIPEIVSGSGTPLVPPDNIDALADAMTDALADTRAAANRALLLRSTIRERFTVAAMTRDVLGFYSSALAERAAA
jgi:glycosyltransferase involved in cell wall biosynthesis